MSRLLLILMIVTVAFETLWAQSTPIVMESADSLYVNRKTGKYSLFGNVRFKHDSLRFVTDYANWDKRRDNVEFRGGLKITHPKGMIQSKSGNYSRRNNQAQAYGNVFLRDSLGELTLTGDSLDYQRNEGKVDVWGSRPELRKYPKSKHPDSLALRYEDSNQQGEVKLIETQVPMESSKAHEQTVDKSVDSLQSVKPKFNRIDSAKITPKFSKDKHRSQPKANLLQDLNYPSSQLLEHAPTTYKPILSSYDFDKPANPWDKIEREKKARFEAKKAARLARWGKGAVKSGDDSSKTKANANAKTKTISKNIKPKKSSSKPRSSKGKKQDLDLSSDKDTLSIIADHLKYFQDDRKAQALRDVVIHKGQLNVNCDSAYFDSKKGYLKLSGSPQARVGSYFVKGIKMEIWLDGSKLEKIKVWGDAFGQQSDSITNPKDVQWTEVEGDSMEVIFKNDNVEYLQVDGSGEGRFFDESRKEYVNKINGKSLKIDFEDSSPRLAKVRESARTKYFFFQDNGDFGGWNEAQGDSLDLRFQGSKLEKISIKGNLASGIFMGADEDEK